VVAGWYSKSAHAKIGQAGGQAQNLKGETFEFPKPKKKFIPREKAPKKAAAAAAESEAPAAGGEAPQQQQQQQPQQEK
jgi:hypothetical protein